ncbi:hypothetical protein Msub_10232 [Marinobacter subterrani]|uniref:Uncharacterized protein n=1 Tax=Marinobacter subterrani TaxID=1658765 RepID=A0A0J7J848_9GAMM|nr:hypothetical protein Msub_10232 [Marinobacter subterrani]
MAPETRTLNARKVPDDCSGLPRDLNTELPVKTVAQFRAVLCLRATTKTAAKHPTKEHRSKAFNAKLSGAPTGASGGRPTGREQT